MTPQERAEQVAHTYYSRGPTNLIDLIADALTATRRAALLEARQAVLGERLSATEIYSSEDEVYNDAIDDALGAIDRLAQEG